MVLCSGHPEVPRSRSLVRYNTISVLAKPFAPEELRRVCALGAHTAQERRRTLVADEVVLEVLDEVDCDHGVLVDRGEVFLTGIEAILFELGELSDRQQQVLSLYIRGFNNEAGAKALGLALKTYKNTLTIARHACGADGLGELLRVVAAELTRRGHAKH